MNLLYITFGTNITHHLQAAFSIYSFLVYKREILSINIITDAPGFYAHLKDHVNVIPVNEAILQEWKGKHDFFWRIKIKAIESMCNMYVNSPVVYLDTDTFLFGNLEMLHDLLRNNSALMHENEGPLSLARSKTEKRMWDQTRNRMFAGITIGRGHSMWNAGVVATPNNKGGEECRLALALCDEMCAQQITRRLIEQFALSVSLDELYGLKAADPYIGHYWSNKVEWDEQISAFFVQSYLKGYDFQENIRSLEKYSYESIPVKRKIKKTRKRIEYFLDKIFPLRGTSISRIKK